ncbi:hypothetical protein [Haloarchaeobius sp. HME9146]|uniref:hypothetical protein n=1 Tax=Haloarchaeobius sp. HME9146 TaxID=2978732 RepID=UPI0021C0661F|nr:hypothetical protein [Haloarchaeobius sp. HME9146]MCT9096073.1 hypothetical protein [Haloarchaeobius sp. HME9146]
MPTRRLSVFDVVADLVPGVVFLLFLSPVYTAASFPTRFFPELNSTLLLVAVGYPVGRVLHAVASRGWAAATMAHIGWRTASWPLGGSPQLSRIAVSKETREGDGSSRTFTLRDRLAAVERDDGSAEAASIEHEVLRQLSRELHRLVREDGESSDDGSRAGAWESDDEYLEHLGHSILHGESTLYHRYTVLATFYRNLWTAVLLGSVGFVLSILVRELLVQPVARTSLVVSLGNYDLIASYPALVSGALLGGALVVAVVLQVLSVRWLEYRYRRLRAMVNDLYLALDSTPSQRAVDPPQNQ